MPVRPLLAAALAAAASLPVAPAAALARAPAAADTDAARIRTLEARVERLEAELARRPLDISSYALPSSVELCGQKVALADPDVRERLERELYLVLGDREQVVLWTKRARRVFPTIDAEVKRTGACPDVRYLAVIESGLRPGVTSHANAHGWWQFMAPTARDYGLAVDSGWDERADLGPSTRAGVAYLRDLAGSFGGDWALAMAAYNTGPGRLRNAMEQQGRRDFWRLDLIDEAERYVPRVLAAKIVMSDLGGYGFDLSVADGYAPEPLERVSLRLPVGRSVSLLEAARAVGVDYRTLRRHNPALDGAALPAGRTFTLAVPPDRADAARALASRYDGRAEPRTLARADADELDRGRAERDAAAEDAPADRRADRPARAEPRRAAAPAARPVETVVRKGDSLGSIAARHKVSVDELRRWNRLGRKDPLRQGQKLIVRK